MPLTKSLAKVGAKTPLLVWHLQVTRVDLLNDALWWLVLNSAANGSCSAQDLLHGTAQLLGKGLVAHLACDLDDLVEGDVAAVLDVLLLLPVTSRLLEGLDDKSRCGWDDSDGSLTVLDGQLDGNTQTLPVTGGLGNVFSDLLGGLRSVGKVKDAMSAHLP